MPSRARPHHPGADAVSAVMDRERGLTAEEVGELLGGYKARTVCEDFACKPGFPLATYAGPNAKPRWIKGEILDYREASRVSRIVHRRKRRNKSANFSSPDVQ